MNFIVYFILMIERSYTISGEALEILINHLDRAAHYCEHARSSWETDERDEPTASYPGSSGYAGATARTVSQYLRELTTQ
jgi:hypothetical protein